MKIEIPDIIVSAVILLGGGYVIYDLFFKQQPPITNCLAYPLCGPGQIVDPMKCQCVNICPTPAISCGNGLRWNWCVQGCVPAGSLMPDCQPPPCGV